MFPTLLGKLFVFFVLVCSLLFAAMALGLYGNRINWPDTPGAVAGENAEGEIAKLQAEIKKLSDRVESGRIGWQAARADLADVEGKRAADLAWYDEQAKMRMTGKDKKGDEVQNPVKAVAYKDGKVQLQKDGRPVLEDLDLKSVEQLRIEANDTEQEIKAVVDAVNKALDEQKKLTLEIKKLRVLIAEEAQTAQYAASQVEGLEPQLYNREVESQMLVQRQRLLQARLKQLQSQGVASRRP